jgi:L1 cell adhesion molecule like protein
MLKEAEEHAEADKQQREKVEAKNHLESYLYSLRSTLDDEAFKTKIVGDDRETLNKKVTEALSWLEEHPNEDKDSYDGKKKEVEDVANPIIAKAYQAGPPGSGGAGASGSSDDSQGSGPTVEEADD